MIHLDTSFLIRAMVIGSPEDLSLRVWLRENVPLEMSATAWGEYLCGRVGARTAMDVRGFLRGIAPVGEEEAHLAAQLFDATGRRRGSFADCMIAATAIVASAALATTNPRDFSRVAEHDLKLVP